MKDSVIICSPSCYCKRLSCFHGTKRRLFDNDIYIFYLLYLAMQWDLKLWNFKRDEARWQSSIQLMCCFPSFLKIYVY